MVRACKKSREVTELNFELKANVSRIFYFRFAQFYAAFNFRWANFDWSSSVFWWNLLWRHHFPYLHNTKTWISLKRRKEKYQKGKRQFSLLWKARVLFSPKLKKCFVCQSFSLLKTLTGCQSPGHLVTEIVLPVFVFAKMFCFCCVVPRVKLALFHCS